jgi:hypothetical protein
LVLMKIASDIETALLIWSESWLLLTPFPTIQYVVQFFLFCYRALTLGLKFPIPEAPTFMGDESEVYRLKSVISPTLNLLFTSSQKVKA